ncbi:MAG: FecR family protein [Bryobacteraceae bacterium]|nr:FecR family protein [Bryobacteraceae bacterium]
MLSIRQIVAAWLCLTALGVVCSAPVSAQQGPAMFGSDGAARVIQLTGQVSVLKDSTPWALQMGSTVNVRQVIMTGADGFAVFQVSDGSTFEVYPNSRVTFRANPGNWKDLLDVWLGRVKVHIEKLGGLPNNNKVNTPTAVISVRGTTFDVAVEDEDTTLVSVDEGIVDVQHRLLPTKEPKRLMQGDSIRVYRDQPLAKAGVKKDAIVQHTLAAAQEALYRIIFRSPTGSGGGIPGGSTGGQPLPGESSGGGTSNPAPPPPSTSPSTTGPPPPPPPPAP